MKKKLLIGSLLAAFLLPAVIAFGAKVPISWDSDFANQIVEPLKTFSGALIKGSWFTATSTTQTNVFPRVSSTYSTSTQATSTYLSTTNASTTNLTVSGLGNTSTN